MVYCTGRPLQAHLQGTLPAIYTSLLGLPVEDQGTSSRGKARLCTGDQQRASRPRSSSRCCSWMLALRDWSGHSCCSPPNMPLKCHWGGPTSPATDTMPTLASTVNVPAYAHSSHLGGGIAQASFNDEDVWEDDFQTPHTPVCHIVLQAMENQLQRRWKPPGEAPAGNHITKWMLVRRRLRCLSLWILIGGPPTGSK